MCYDAKGVGKGIPIVVVSPHSPMCYDIDGSNEVVI